MWLTLSHASVVRARNSNKFVVSASGRRAASWLAIAMNVGESYNACPFSKKRRQRCISRCRPSNPHANARESEISSQVSAFQTACYRRSSMAVVAAIVTLLMLAVRCPSMRSRSIEPALDGQQLYQAACAACHGSDGRGQPVAVRGFDIDPPDFTDCSLTTPEADLDWLSVVHQGGPARAFDRMMPAFGDELTEAEIVRVIDHVRTFCAERGWPRGDLNLPRPFVTEKAFPENEAVLTTTIVPSTSGRSAISFSTSIASAGAVNTKCSCRSTCRVGTPARGRSAWGISAPRTNTCCSTACRADRSCRRAASSRCRPAASRKGSATGSRCSRRSAPSARCCRTTDFSMRTPASKCRPTQNGPRRKRSGGSRSARASWRTAGGARGRRWSRCSARASSKTAATAEWDVLPQLQVSLSTRQHVLLNIGVRTPLSQRSERRTSVLVYLLWDWFDGGFFSGW